MRLNLFFNPSWRSEGQINIDMKVERQRICLQQMLDGKEETPDDETLKWDFCMFDIKLEKKDMSCRLRRTRRNTTAHSDF